MSQLDIFSQQFELFYRGINKTPAFLFSKSKAIENFEFFYKCLKINLEDVFFSVKTNNNLELLNCLKQANCNFEISSLGELMLLKELNVEPHRIIFSNPVKIEQHIEFAYNYGVKTFAYDTENEIIKIAKYAPQANVFLRLKASNYGADWQLLNKFGAGKEQAVELLKLAENKQLKPVGLSFHAGWNNCEISTWQENFSELKALVEKCLQHGIKLQFIDIGGGFPAHNSFRQYDFLEKISQTLNYNFEILRKKHNIKIIAEPGSFIATNVGGLLVRVFDIIVRDKKKWVYVDSGINQGFYWIYSGLNYQIVAIKNSENVEKELCIVAGPTCDTHDIFSDKVLLPINLQVNDLLFIYPAGAYTNSSQNYNGFTYPETICF